MGDLKKDPEVICSVINKFQEFDASLDYDIKRIAQYPSMLVDIFQDINFDKQRLFLSEKVELNGYKKLRAKTHGLAHVVRSS